MQGFHRSTEDRTRPCRLPWYLRRCSRAVARCCRGCIRVGRTSAGRGGQVDLQMPEGGFCRRRCGFDPFGESAGRVRRVPGRRITQGLILYPDRRVRNPGATRLAYAPVIRLVVPLIRRALWYARRCRRNHPTGVWGFHGPFRGRCAIRNRPAVRSASWLIWD